MLDDYEDTEPLTLDDIRQKRMSAEEFRRYWRSTLGPSWRWIKAGRVAARRRVSGRVERGSVFWRCVDYIDGLPADMRDKLCGDGQLDISSAEAIYRDPVKRLEVDARLVAGLSPEEAAARCGLNAETVRDYCEIFFDVLDSLRATDWLAIHIFDPADEAIDNLYTTVCRESYQGGPAVCEYWLERVPHLDEPCDLTTIAGREMKRLHLTLLQDRLMRTTPDRLGEIAIRVGDLSSQLPPSFVNASDVIGRRAAQQLGLLLNRDDNGAQTLPFTNGTHSLVDHQTHIA
ncbi:hypothetical protein [Allorhodopirellula solitaria]|uniref:Uncharacterized protein n=1 Tax=Allorhodopirellula solitaria TaxID=2527987 RepID=A0A5C5X0P9_9BACT|nr:hypothetical protein [Allorhodopirellula solitaria]TWT56526.1 hypothetical protein CA85_40590 [Allorhodopirellula solitaria]